MPGQIQSRQVGSKTFIENAFNLAFNIFIIDGRFRSLKESRRGQLLRIAHHHHLLATSDSTDYIPDCNLRGLVEYHDIKLLSIWREELSD